MSERLRYPAGFVGAHLHGKARDPGALVANRQRIVYFFPPDHRFASWLRLCPPQDESNKTKKRRGHRKATSRVTIALRMCVRSVGQTMTPLGLFYRRIRSRIGGRGAVKETAQVGVFGLPDAQVRPGVCHAVDGRVRGQGEGQYVERR